MDFNLPEELQVLKIRFANLSIESLFLWSARTARKAKICPSGCKPLQEKAQAIGLWLLDVPQEYGSAGLDLHRGFVHDAILIRFSPRTRNLRGGRTEA